MSQKWIVGGVPEHFNLPWQRALESGCFMGAGLDLEFREYPTGTGAMCADLRAGVLDLAVVLTEGILMDIALFQQSAILAPFVNSPLIWGVHFAADADPDLDHLDTQKMAVSRLGSGSHLMGLLWAQAQGVSLRPDQIIPVGSMFQLQEAVQQQADYFLWEKFTTLPLVKQGLVKRVDTITTPWPCFMIAGQPERLAQREAELGVLLQQLYQQAKDCQHQQEQTLDDISIRYGIDREESLQWFRDVEWATQTALPLEDLQKTLQTLQGLGLIPDQAFALQDFIWQPQRTTA